MNHQKLYSLKLLFNQTQITSEELKSQADTILTDYLSQINLKIDTTHFGALLLTLQGTIEVTDKCHDKINKKLVTELELSFSRLLDEAGDEIRQQAYPILAEIEQRFRRFVNQAIVEVCGFSWGNTLAPVNMRDKVQSIREKHQEDGSSLDFLECTQFDDLITIITAEVSEWSEDKVLTIHDFIEFLDCDSRESKENLIKNKLKKFSFWEVFSRYFQDKSKWDELKRDINFVINIRHKVMHHRPIRLGTIKALLDKKTKILNVLNSAKPELTVEELAEAQKDIKDIEDIQKTVSVSTNLQLDAQIKTITQAPRNQNPQLEAHLKLITEPLRNQNAQLEVHLKQITATVRNQNTHLEAKFKAIAEPIYNQNVQLERQLKNIAQPLSKQNAQLNTQLKTITENVRRPNHQLDVQLNTRTEPFQSQNAQLNKELQTITEALRRQNTELNRKFKDLVEPIHRQNTQSDIQLKAIAEPFRKQNARLEAQLKAIVEPFHKQNAQLDTQLKAIVESFRKQNTQLQVQIQQITKLSLKA